MIVNSCGVDRRSSAQIANDPYDTNNPVSQEARANQADSPEQVSTSPSGGEVAQLNARIAELEAENARLLAQQGAPADQSGGEAIIARLKAALTGKAYMYCEYVTQWRRARADSKYTYTPQFQGGYVRNLTDAENASMERCVKSNQLF